MALSSATIDRSVRSVVSPFGERLRQSNNLANQAYKVAGVLGVAGAMRQLYMQARHQGDYSVTVQPRGLRHPIHMTSAIADVYNVREVVRDGAYAIRPEAQKGLNGKAIVDIGAFIGISAAYFASRYDRSPVVAIEPLARNYELLTRNAEPYAGQIRTVQAAMTAKKSSVGIVDHQFRHPYMPLYAPTDAEIGEQGSIASITPDELMTVLDPVHQIGILKVDIEGAEKDIFAHSAITQILDRTEVLLIETHDQFVPGCSETVALAAAASQMQPHVINDHTMSYSR